MSKIMKQLVVKYYPVTPVLIGGDPYHVYSYVLSTKNVRQKSEPKTSAGAIHYINILDRSGSMYRDIDDVIDQAQALFSQIRAQDFWSLIWFSSPGDFKVLLKGAQYSPKLGELLDTIRSVRGTTCFSDPIKETERTIDELSTIADNVVVTLFTDGCPVVSDVKAEMTLCQSLVTGMKKKIIAFNTIGFGNYYNREFMQNMSSCSEQGRYVHISNIREFEPVYRETAERARDMTNCSVMLAATGAQIMYQSGKTVLLKDDELDLDHVDLDDNRITVLVPEGKNSASVLRVDQATHAVQLHGNGFSDIKEREIDGVVFKDEKCAPLAPEVIYAYASALYANKKTKRAREIVVRNMGDKRLADAITSSFTYAEMGSTSKMFEEAIVDADTRQINSCDASYIPSPDATCVMEILGVLADSQSKYVPFAYKSSTEGLCSTEQLQARELLKPYQRVREKVVDTQDIFHSLSGEVQAPCTDLVYAEDRPNVSLRFTIPGTATLNARAASRVGLPEEYPVRRYQVHTFIKDGNLNVPHAEFILDAATDAYIFVHDVPHTVINKIERRIIIHFEKMPVINENMMNDAMLNLSALATATKKMLENEAAQKVLKERIKSLHEEVGVSSEMTEDFAALNEDQIQVLLDHGIDKRSVYGGISKERIERTENSDFYMVREISLYPTGISSLPTVASVVKKMEDGKKLTPREEVIASAIEVAELAESLHETDFEARLELLTNMLESCKSRLVRYRNELSRFKIAMVLQSDYESFSSLEFNDKGVAEFDGVCLSMKRVQQYV